MRTRLPWILLAISVVLNLCAVGGYLYGKRMADEHRAGRSPIAAAARSIDMTDAQKQAFAEMRQSVRKSSADIRAEMRPLREAMLAELAKPQPDFAIVDGHIDSLGDVQGKRYKAMVRSLYEFQQTLTPQQQEAFRKGMADHFARRMMQRGRSGDSAEKR